MSLEKTISIALCTYNGERFLQEQLVSIGAQTVRPFELIICDDGSSDSTSQLLNNFAATAAFPVKLYFNPQNLGYVKNFEKAISLCRGDIIALCDQDDKWRPNKLETIQKYFSDPNIGMVFSDGLIIDDNGNPTGETLWEIVHFTPKLYSFFEQDKAYKLFNQRIIVSGCTMAFRRKYWPLIQPIPEDIYFIHDGWIALMTSLFADVAYIKQPLIEHREHSQQSVPLNRNEKLASLERMVDVRNGERQQHYRIHLNQLRVIRERVLSARDNILPAKWEYLLEWNKAHEQHLITRLEADSDNKNCKEIIRELITGRYHRFSNGFQSVIADLMK